MLIYITPCSRPESLPRLRESITDQGEWRWIIVYDLGRVPEMQGYKYPIDPRISEYWHRSSPQGRVGNDQRNFALDLLRKQASCHDYVYFLDDDNIVHPRFTSAILPIIREGDYQLITFGQERHDGVHIDGTQLLPGRADTAMFVARLDLVGSSTWASSRYDADGAFLEELSRKDPTWIVVPHVAAYYNYLRSTSTTSTT